VATDFWTRLDLAIKATAASREARMAELQALEIDPDTFVQEGIVWLKPWSSWWEYARLSGGRDALKLSTSVKFLHPCSTFVIPRDRIRRLSIVWAKLRIEHSQESCPACIAFRPSPSFWPDLTKLESELTRLGYNVED
jgi:hypothetical protein